jgi:hypothetical protein
LSRLVFPSLSLLTSLSVCLFDLSLVLSRVSSFSLPPTPGDVYGNALLVSSPRKKSQPNRLLPLAHNRAASPPLASNDFLIRKGVHSSRLLGQRKPNKLLPPVTLSTKDSSTTSVVTTTSSTSSKAVGSSQIKGRSGVGGAAAAEGLGKENERELYRKCVYQLALLPGTSDFPLKALTSSLSVCLSLFLSLSLLCCR